MKQALDEAAKKEYALGGFNVNNMEQIQAVMNAAQETFSPVILQVSRGGREYANDHFLIHLFKAAVESYPTIPIVLHQDHGDIDSCISAINLGFTSVMIDGSLLEDKKTPSPFEYNVKVTQKVVAYAHAKGVSVEAELGCIGGIEDGVGFGKNPFAYLTDPDQAVEFVNKTKVDSLAVAIGTSHGAYKFAKKPDHSALAMERIIEIHKRLPNTHLVMHGSSSVPQELQELINKYGGNIKQTWGVPIEEIQLGIKNGVRKVNVDTDSRLAITGAIRQYFAENPSEFDPRIYLQKARDFAKEVISKRMIIFGQANRIGDYIPQSLDKMKKAYTI